ncbi:hypothetical protein GGF46_001205 [Coemansia sp. RSA 552]|nr:hypothetical protein GGF46_001205 [Coemansia sp. RSA 552]
MLTLRRVTVRGLFFVVGCLLGLLYLLDIYGVLRAPDVDAWLGSIPSANEEQDIRPPQRPSNSAQDQLNQSRQQAVLAATQHAWRGYSTFAFGKDELQPLSQSFNGRWGSWAITLLDSLDTLYLMGMEEEYKEAKAFAETIDFEQSPEGHRLMVFEMTIRALGGLLGAYELDHDPMLLRKAREVGDVLSRAFNTTTGLPSGLLDLNRPGWKHEGSICIAEAGSFQLEFKKLSQLTGDDKYWRIAERASDALENAGRRFQGLYPMYVHVRTGTYNNFSSYSMGAMADSFYEYLLKQYVLSDSRELKYRERYELAADTVAEKLVGRSKKGYMYLGRLSSDGSTLYREMEHLACFYPGVLALGSKALGRPQDLELAEELAYTCYQTYATSPTGLGPEVFYFPEYTPRWKAPNAKRQGMPGREDMGITAVDKRYILRPETVESLFVLYRITGDDKYQQWGWDIFSAIERHAKVANGYAALNNVMETNQTENQKDSMESFFLAETLKYLYLLFSPTDVLPLDQYVFTTEAHPLRVMTQPDVIE